jgi:hypothetical protein
MFWGRNIPYLMQKHNTMCFSIVLVLRSYTFKLGFPAISLYLFLISRMHATCPAHLILFDLITVTFGYVGMDNHELQIGIAI